MPIHWPRRSIQSNAIKCGTLQFNLNFPLLMLLSMLLFQIALSLILLYSTHMRITAMWYVILCNFFSSINRELQTFTLPGFLSVYLVRFKWLIDFISLFFSAARKQCTLSSRRLFSTTPSAPKIYDQVDDIWLGWSNISHGKHKLFTSCQKWHILCPGQCLELYFLVPVSFSSENKFNFYNYNFSYKTTSKFKICILKMAVISTKIDLN